MGVKMGRRWGSKAKKLTKGKELSPGGVARKRKEGEGGDGKKGGGDEGNK